jgi:hypothetical protein
MRPADEPRPDRKDPVVLAGGLATTVVTLFAVYLIERVSGGELAIMRWYALVIPVGALLAGMVACSGYGIASWITGRKISGRLLLTVVLLQILAFGGAQWVEFSTLHLVHENGDPVSFLDYIRITSTSMKMTFELGPASFTSGQLGAIGYLLRFLEMCGFAVGAVLLPAALSWRPYCETCRSYMRTRRIGLIPGAAPGRKFRADDPESQRTLEAGVASANALLAAAAQGDASGIRKIIDGYAADRKTARRRPKIEVVLIRCPSCGRGAVSCRLVSEEDGRIGKTDIGTQEIPAALTASLR